MREYTKRPSLLRSAIAGTLVAAVSAPGGPRQALIYDVWNGQLATTLQEPPPLMSPGTLRRQSGTGRVCCTV